MPPLPPLPEGKPAQSLQFQIDPNLNNNLKMPATPSLPKENSPQPKADYKLPPLPSKNHTSQIMIKLHGDANTAKDKLAQRLKKIPKSVHQMLLNELRHVLKQRYLVLKH